MGLSLRPSDAQQGGFLDDLDVTLKECRFVIWDYMGQAKPTVALHVHMVEDSGGIATDYHQYYSAGDPAKVVPSDDGKTVVPQAGATGLNTNTNAIAFITSIVNAGFPEDKITDDASVFDGLVCHINQVAQPKRSSLKDQKEGKTYALVTKILRLPWETVPKAPAKGAPVPRPGPKPVATLPAATPGPSTPPAAAAADNGPLTQKARDVVLGILAEKGGSLVKSKLATEAFRALASDSDRNAIVMLLTKDTFLQDAIVDGVLMFDGTTVTLG